jgi:proteasome accessory factor A
MNEPTCPARLPKLAGADIELGNFLLGAPGGGAGGAAARALLAEIDGLPSAGGWGGGYGSGWSGRGCAEGSRDQRGSSAGWDPQDWGRKFLPSNGGCAYIDLDHLELCVPEVLSAWDHLAAWHAMLRIARDALESANARLPAGRSIQVLVNNSDGHGHSYGSHLSFLLTRRAWDNLIRRKPHYLGWLASFQVSSIIYTGQGKVGSENNAPPVEFQLSQRADYFETLLGVQTTFERPIVNARDETLCGYSRLPADPASPARLHVIFFDNTLAHYSSLLKVGVMQLVLAMLEAGCVDPRLVLDDPLSAVCAFSHDPTLRRQANLAAGGAATAVELQLRFLEEARRFDATGGFDGFVPRAAEILDLWEEVLAGLADGDWLGLSSKLDWVMKLMTLRRAMRQRPSLTWESPEVRHLDQLYSSLAEDGLYWSYENAGFAARLVSEERVRHFCAEPPEDTRAWTRAMLLRTAEPGWVERVDWDHISFRLREDGYWPRYRRLDLNQPLGMTAATAAPLFAGAECFSGLLDALEARESADCGPARLSVN